MRTRYNQWVKSLREYWSLLFTYLKPQGIYVLGLVVVLGINIGLQLFTPRILRDFIDMALTGASYESLARTAGLFFSMVILTQILSIASTYVSESVAWTATNFLRIDLAEHCLRLDLAFHQANPPGALIERVEGDVDALSNFFSQFLVRVVANVALIVGVLVMLYRENIWAGVAMTFFASIAIIAMMRVRAIGVPRWLALRQKSAEAFGFLGEVLNGTEDIRASGAADYILHRFDLILSSWLPLRRRASMGFSLIWTTTLLLFAFGTSVSFAAGYLLWSAGAITAGTVYLIFNYTEIMRQPIEQLRSQLEDLQRASASIARVRELLSREPKIRDGAVSRLPDGALHVEFKDVTFRYSGDETALDRIGFELTAGKVLGLLGRTGSGKSTLARLLLRLYDPTAGQICLNGIELQAARLAELTRRVALVSQEVQIFRASVRDNLAFFDRSIPDDRILDVIEEFEMGDWLRSLPEGLETELGSTGLSAGQAQLLSFARVALRDPGLVILDEATSRLDLATEALIDRATERILKGRTGIIIAHRLQTVHKANRIMILEAGSIMEYDERLTLLQNPNSRFSRLLSTGLEDVLA